MIENEYTYCQIVHNSVTLELPWSASPVVSPPLGSVSPFGRGDSFVLWSHGLYLSQWLCHYTSAPEAHRTRWKTGMWNARSFDSAYECPHQPFSICSSLGGRERQRYGSCQSQASIVDVVHPCATACVVFGWRRQHAPYAIFSNRHCRHQPGSDCEQNPSHQNFCRSSGWIHHLSCGFSAWRVCSNEYQFFPLLLTPRRPYLVYEEAVSWRVETTSFVWVGFWMVLSTQWITLMRSGLSQTHYVAFPRWRLL